MKRLIVLALTATLSAAAFGQDWQNFYLGGLNAAKAKNWPDARIDFQEASKARPGDSMAVNLPGSSSEQEKWRHGAPYSPDFLAAYCGLKEAVEAPPGDSRTTLLSQVKAEFESLYNRRQYCPALFFFLDETYVLTAQTDKRIALAKQYAAIGANATWKVDTGGIDPEDIAMVAELPSPAGQNPPTPPTTTNHFTTAALNTRPNLAQATQTSDTKLEQSAHPDSQSSIADTRPKLPKRIQTQPLTETKPKLAPHIEHLPLPVADGSEPNNITIIGQHLTPKPWRHIHITEVTSLPSVTTPVEPATANPTVATGDPKPASAAPPAPNETAIVTPKIQPKTEIVETKTDPVPPKTPEQISVKAPTPIAPSKPAQEVGTVISVNQATTTTPAKSPASKTEVKTTSGVGDDGPFSLAQVPATPQTDIPSATISAPSHPATSPQATPQPTTTPDTDSKRAKKKNKRNDKKAKTDADATAVSAPADNTADHEAPAPVALVKPVSVKQITHPAKVNSSATGGLTPDDTKYALIIGNAESKMGGGSIPYASDDAQQVRQALIKDGGYLDSHVEVVINATAAQIADSVNALAARIPDKGVALIYFTGVGANIDGKDYFAGVDSDAGDDTSTMISKDDVYKAFMQRGARIYAFFQANRPIQSGHYFGSEMPLVGSISQMQATLPGEAVFAVNADGKQVGIFTQAFTSVLKDIHSSETPIMDFGWQLFYRLRSGGTGSEGGSSNQSPSLPVLTNMSIDARF